MVAAMAGTAAVMVVAVANLVMIQRPLPAHRMILLIRTPRLALALVLVRVRTPRLALALVLVLVRVRTPRLALVLVLVLAAAATTTYLMVQGLVLLLAVHQNRRKNALLILFYMPENTKILRKLTVLIAES